MEVFHLYRGYFYKTAFVERTIFMREMLEHLTDAACIYQQSSPNSEATQQLINLLAMTGISGVIGLPQLTPGRMYPIQSVSCSQSMFYPTIIEDDLGSGITLIETDVNQMSAESSRWKKRLTDIRHNAKPQWLEYAYQAQQDRHISSSYFDDQIAEMQSSDRLLVLTLSESFTTTAKITIPSATFVMMIGGSCGLGRHVIQHYTEQYGYRGLSPKVPGFESFQERLKQVIAFASLHRDVITQRALACIQAGGKVIADHAFTNICASAASNASETSSPVDNEQWIHRQGAFSADKETLLPVIDATFKHVYLLRINNNPLWQRKLYQSLPFIMATSPEQLAHRLLYLERKGLVTRLCRFKVVQIVDGN